MQLPRWLLLLISLSCLSAGLLLDIIMISIPYYSFLSFFFGLISVSSVVAGCVFLKAWGIRAAKTWEIDSYAIFLMGFSALMFASAAAIFGFRYVEGWIFAAILQRIGLMMAVFATGRRSHPSQKNFDVALYYFLAICFIFSGIKGNWNGFVISSSVFTALIGCILADYAKEDSELPAPIVTLDLLEEGVVA